MATLHTDANGYKYVRVQKGDTLSQIAIDYKSYSNNATYQQLAAINGIPNSNLIYVGQKIYLTSSSSSSSSSGTTNSSSNKAIIKHFGLQSNTDRTVFATWDWNKSNTESYKVRWLYYTGDGVAFNPGDTTTELKQATYNAPANAHEVAFHVKPISKKKKDANGKETSYWTADWSDRITYKFSSNPPVEPSVPKVTIEDYTLTARVDEVDANTKQIEFQIVKNDLTVYKTGKANVITSTASYSCKVAAGSEYKVRCRAINNNGKSDWSGYSNNAGTAPAASAGIISLKALSETEVQLDWANVSNATSYKIEYTTNKRYFDSSNEVQSITVDATAAGHAEITGLTSGEEYFFRVKAINEHGESAWTAIRSIIIGKAPSAPTTWSSTTTAIVGDNVTLFWVHNSADGSSQTYAELEVYVNNTELNIPIIKNSTDEDEKDLTSSYVLKTSSFTDGAQIKWRVRTKGILNEYGDWSIQRTIDVYAPPTLEMEVTNSDGTPLETLTSFPIYISALAGPNTQVPIGYHVSVVSNEIYETTDDVGKVKMVTKGEEVYSRFFDTSDELIVELSAGNVDLQNNISYTVYCTVSMDSGLTAEAFVDFTVRWIDPEYQPNAEIAYDSETIVTHIKPYCENSRLTYHKVNYVNRKYLVSTNTYYNVYRDRVISGAFTTTGEQVYFGVTPDGDEIYYCEVETKTPITNVLLSVYRREFDGSFTELAKDLDGSLNTFITDPHPALDYARYRIVAKDVDTGAISFYDMPGYPIGEKSIVIQWDEEWSNFEVNADDPLEQPPWSGSLLKLPFNVDVSDKNATDVTFAEYIGRKRPVAYYGTQLGESSTWSTAIRMDDEETLYALRRLAAWNGNVYAREPSGTGYWANVSVSYDQKHLATTIPVTLELTRVEGGI